MKHKKPCEVKVDWQVKVKRGMYRPSIQRWANLETQGRLSNQPLFGIEEPMIELSTNHGTAVQYSCTSPQSTSPVRKAKFNLINDVAAFPSRGVCKQMRTFQAVSPNAVFL